MFTITIKITVLYVQYVVALNSRDAEMKHFKLSLFIRPFSTASARYTNVARITNLFMRSQLSFFH